VTLRRRRLYGNGKVISRFAVPGFRQSEFVYYQDWGS
jgi:hypothetical protein